MKLQRKDFPLLILFIFACLMVGGLSGFFNPGDMNIWYANLIKPEWTPPNWIFGPVWTVLYILMGLAAFLVYREGFKRREVKIALGLFSLQLGLNFFWSILFFTFNNLRASFVEIIFLWVAIVATIISFYRISRPAAWIMVPYLLWVTFASILNYRLLILN